MTDEEKELTPEEWETSPERQRLVRAMWLWRLGAAVCWAAMVGVTLVAPWSWRQRAAMVVLGTVLMMFPWGGSRYGRKGNTP